MWLSRPSTLRGLTALPTAPACCRPALCPAASRCSAPRCPMACVTRVPQAACAPVCACACRRGTAGGSRGGVPTGSVGCPRPAPEKVPSASAGCWPCVCVCVGAADPVSTPKVIAITPQCSLFCCLPWIWRSCRRSGGREQEGYAAEHPLPRVGWRPCYRSHSGSYVLGWILESR